MAGPSFLQFLNKLFQTYISAGDIIQFESGNNSKYYMLSATGTWDEIITVKSKIICEITFSRINSHDCSIICFSNTKNG